MDLYRKVRLACAEGMSQREAARHFNISRDSVAKMMAFSVPPGYRRTAPVKRPKLDAFTGIIDGWLDGDREVHRKQRHTAKRVFERLRDEHGFTGGYVGEVVIGCGGEVIARHPRCHDREDMVFDPVHYLPLIERKINALEQAAPLAGWELPSEFATLRRLMEARMIKAGRREYVQVLRLLETFGIDDLHAAVKKALQLGAVGFDAVKHLVLCHVEKRPPKLDLDIYPYLPRANVETTSVASYMALTSEAAE